MLLLYLISIVPELLIYYRPFWRHKQAIIVFLLLIIGFSTGGIIVNYPVVLTLPLIGIVLFRIFNLLRISKRRMNDIYLLQATRRTSHWLILYTFILGSAYFAFNSFLALSDLIFIYASASLMAGIGVLGITLLNIYKTRHVPVLDNYADRDLPTVTVAIPARNETPELEDCIKAILANNYPKLEVIVLDDCSRDKTPEIIRRFAQDGVRFIRGTEPDERWLAKNLAYERLAKEASGDLILFCGVDVRLGPEAIRALVSMLLSREKAMISILPRRLTSNATAALIQPMRYWWELALLRRPFNRPPVLSTCWLINRDTLISMGGFAAVSHTIIPEGYFARELVKSDKYSFIRADDLLDVQTRKTLRDQRETALRLRYPQLRRRPEWVLLLSSLELIGLLAPFAIAVSGFWLGFDLLRLMFSGGCVFLLLTHLAIVQISNPANVLVAVLNFPVVVATEIILGYASMIQYELATVEWKDRNICIPVMHVVPHLPKA